MYYICGIDEHNESASVTCLLTKPIFTEREAKIRFEKSREYSDTMCVGLYDDKACTWLGVILNKKNNPSLLDFFNDHGIKPCRDDYPLTNYDI